LRINDVARDFNDDGFLGFGQVGKFGFHFVILVDN
jgi:hypothetical protein